MKTSILTPATWLSLAAMFGPVSSTSVLHRSPISGDAAVIGLTADSSGAMPALAPWCDSTVVRDTITPGGRQIPIVACSATPAESTALRSAFTSVTRAVNLYGRLTGIPYPWPRYDMQVQPASPMAMGGRATGQGTMLYQGVLPNTRTERDRPDVTAKILVHELAHQWFSQYVTNVGRSGWLSEGFSDFMTGQFWGATQGPRAEEEFLFFYNVGWSSANGQAPGSHADRTMGEYAPYGVYSIPWPEATIWNGSLDTDDDLYYRGAVVLWMLKQQLGEARFWASVRTYLTTHAHGTANSEDFQRAIQTTTGENLDWFFKEWVFGTGYPQFKVASTYDASARRVTLQVAQTAPVFRMPVMVRVGTSRGEVTAHATLDSASQTVIVDNVTGPPTFVVFDDGDAIVKTLQFEQPTAWLAAQLRRDARPRQTWWAIEQLRQRAAKDPVAATALITAVRKSPYALTRAQAAVALGAVKTSASVAALTQGARDTAVIVRRGVLQGLEAIGTPATVAVARSMFAHDSSDLVRADAIQSVLVASTISPAERQALFAQALALNTYRDVVRIVALKIMLIAGCDSATLATIHTALRTPNIAKDVETTVRSMDPLLQFIAPSCREPLAAQLP